jgi:hypothetical protein
MLSMKTYIHYVQSVFITHNFKCFLTYVTMDFFFVCGIRAKFVLIFQLRSV